MNKDFHNEVDTQQPLGQDNLLLENLLLKQQLEEYAQRTETMAEMLRQSDEQNEYLTKELVILRERAIRYRGGYAAQSGRVTD